jgi:hypothetical protein
MNGNARARDATDEGNRPVAMRYVSPVRGRAVVFIGNPMNARLLLFVLAWSVLISPTARAEEDVLAKLRPGHPRLLVLDADLAAVRQAIAHDPLAKRWHDQLRAEAERMLSAKPIEHVLIGPRLLDKSRTCLTRVSTLAGMYRLDGDMRYARRAILEMTTAAAFADWNPRHFLDTAEMTAALGIGYDWLFDVMSPQEKRAIHDAIVKLGLNEGLTVYERGNWWAKAIHNWNQVCNGGMTVGALAIADEDRKVAARVINYSRESIPRAMASFAPDGGWAEGPGYWSYTTMYTCFYLGSLQTALGTDFGIKQTPGYADTGYFRMHFISPIGETFNYADAHESAGSAFQMMWMGKALSRPLYAAHERSRTERPGIFHLLFWDGDETWPKADFAKAALYKGVDVAFFRSSWNDANAFWVGFKGGDNRANHSHLDLGTFNFDALGQRWALDLGGDDYNMPGYFGNKRWTYYRLRTEGHNTLTIDDGNQEPSAKAPLIGFDDNRDKSFAVADVTAAYGKRLTSWRRGVALVGGKRFVVIDELAAKEPVCVTWNFHTAAKVSVAADGRSAMLTGANGATLQAVIVSPADGRFKVVSASAPPPQRPNAGVSNLTVELPQKVSKAKIQVELASPNQGAGQVEALDQWIVAGKVPK